MKARSSANAVHKIRTGVRGFDDMLEGGIPKGRTLLIAGGAGTGKTVLMNEFVYRGVTSFGEPAVIVTLEERPSDIARNVAGFGWDYASLVRARKLAFVDAAVADLEREIGADYDLTPLVLRIRSAVKRIRAKRVIVDSLDALFERLSQKPRVRELLLQLFAALRQWGVTAMVSTEKTSAGTRYGVEEFVADGMMELSAEPGQQHIVRRIIVRKLRGASYRSGSVEFAIDRQGIEVYPKLSGDRAEFPTGLHDRKPFGIEAFDELLRGGVPAGYMALLSGNTGTGKTTFAQHFLAEGIRRGEPGVYVALEEPSGHIRKLAAGRGWDFPLWERRRKLALVDVPLIDIRPDHVLHRVADAAARIGARRIVIDSLSSLRSATMNEEQVRQFLVQLLEYVKSRGITAVMTYLIPSLFGAEKGQLLPAMSASDVRLSSVCDAVILQRYFERGQRVKKLLTVLKLRGVDHDKAIYGYEIGEAGVIMGGKFEE
jgi:circadian clock protein KaiC